MNKVEVLFLSSGDILRLKISFEDTCRVIREALIEHRDASEVWDSSEEGSRCTLQCHASLHS
jgi:hypothetical protein